MRKLTQKRRINKVLIFYISEKWGYEPHLTFKICEKSSLPHCTKEFIIICGSLHLVFNKFHCFNRVSVRKKTA